MDIAGYIAYLQSALGNQNHYIGSIKELLELERVLDINLDDYIPYNGDCKKIKNLYSNLPDDKLYSKRLAFINNYIRYRLEDYYSKGIENKTYSKSVCSEYFSFSGTQSELKLILSTFMSEEDAQSFINNFNTIIPNLGKDEYIEKHRSYPSYNPKIDYLFIDSTNYNINIKAITITTIALLLDIKLTLGFAATTLAILGINSHAVVKVNVSEGEKCLILEAIQSAKQIINEDVFSSFNSECIHNDLDCKYKSEDKCTIKRDDIKRTLDGLCDKNIFRKINSYYKYNF